MYRQLGRTESGGPTASINRSDRRQSRFRAIPHTRRASLGSPRMRNDAGRVLSLDLARAAHDGQRRLMARRSSIPYTRLLRSARNHPCIKRILSRPRQLHCTGHNIEWDALAGRGDPPTRDMIALFGPLLSGRYMPCVSDTQRVREASPVFGQRGFARPVTPCGSITYLAAAPPSKTS